LKKCTVMAFRGIMAMTAAITRRFAGG